MKFLRIFSVCVLAVLLCVAGLRYYRHYNEQHVALPILGKVPDFTMLTQGKQEFTAESLRGNVVIADFIFTSCAGPCPMMSAQMEDFQEKLKAEPGIKFVSFSVDPETDTPDVLANYGKTYHADFSRWSFLTGSKTAIYNVIRNGFHLAIADDSNSVTHSTKFVLLDKQARIRGYYDFEDSTSGASLMTAATDLEHE